MPLSPQQGKTVTILFMTFIFVILGAVYFKAESGASSVVTMAGEKSLAIYRSERDAALAAAAKALKAEEAEASENNTATSTEEVIE